MLQFEVDSLLSRMADPTYYPDFDDYIWWTKEDEEKSVRDWHATGKKTWEEHCRDRGEEMRTRKMGEEIDDLCAEELDTESTV